jgi:hypothetical protein
MSVIAVHLGKIRAGNLSSRSTGMLLRELLSGKLWCLVMRGDASFRVGTPPLRGRGYSL